MNRGEVSGRAPALCHKRLSALIVAEQVESLVYLLFPANSVLPSLQAFRNPAELDSSGLSHVVKNGVDVFETGSNFSQGIGTLVLRRVDVEKCTSHGVGDFSDLGEEFRSVGKDDEDVFVGLLRSDWVDERFLDF